MRAVRAAWLLAALLSSCAGRAEPEPPSAPPISAESTEDRAPEPEPDPPTLVEPPPDPAPAVTLAHAVDRYGHVSLSLTNRSEGPTRLSLVVLCEREGEGGEFAAADDLGRFELEGTAEGTCAELLSGTELRGTWACLRGEERGEARRACAPAAAGRYRFIAQSCDGRSRTEGDAFAYP